MGQQRFDNEGELVPVVVGGLDAQLDRVVQAEPARAFLLVAAGDRPGRVFAISRNTVIVGRSPDAEIRLNDPSVSNEHARIINGGLGYEVEDLQSRNGTFVGGRRVGRARLNNGDRLRVGTIELTFLLDGAPEATVALAASTVTVAPVVSAPQMRRLGPVREAEEEGPSVEEIVRRGVRAYRFLMRHAAAVVTLVGAGSALGFASVFALPPAPSAKAQIKLHSEVKANPVQQQDGRPAETLQFFAGAERAFTNGELISSTLKKLGEEADEDDVKSVEQRLKFEGLGDQVYAASFDERLFSSGRRDPAAFLDAHIKNYVQTEIDKTLKVFTGTADFLRKKLTDVEKDLAKLNEETVKFREENADQLQDQGLSTAGTTRLQLDTRRSELTALILKLNGEIANAERQLQEGSPLAQTKALNAQGYQTQVQDVERRLTEARARGLADEHPEIRALLNERQAAQAAVEKKITSETTTFEKQANVGYQEIHNKLAILRSERAAAQSQVAELGGSIARFRKVANDLPKIDTQLAGLVQKQTETIKQRAEIFDTLKKAETQLELERVSASSRYELLSAPKLERPGRAKTAVQRVGIGLVLGLFLAALVIAIREGRRLVKHTLDNLHEPAPSP